MVEEERLLRINERMFQEIEVAIQMLSQEPQIHANLPETFADLEVAPPKDWRPNCYCEAYHDAGGCLGEVMWLVDGDQYDPEVAKNAKSVPLGECLACPYLSKTAELRNSGTPAQANPADPPIIPTEGAKNDAEARGSEAGANPSPPSECDDYKKTP